MLRSGRKPGRPTAGGGDGTKPPAAPSSTTLPAPTRGWIANENLAMAQPAGARILDNWFPTSTGARVRGGSTKYATISTGPVLRQWTFKDGDTEQFFSSDEENIFSITTVADPDVIPTPDVSGQTSGYYSTFQIGTAGGNFLYALNGTDDAQLYDGASWLAINAASTPAITGVATAALSFGWSFGSRAWFVEKDTMNAWFLPVDSVGGAADTFSLAGIFQEGGALLFGGRWSLDSGSGLDDKCVFVSNRGEVAIYEGTDPTSAADWRKVGVYKITTPMGFNGTMQAGGDLLIATEDGIVPLSEAVKKDVAALSLSAVTSAIEPEWKKSVQQRRSLPWEIVKWSANNMMVVAIPAPDGIGPYCFVANLETGAWCRFTGWDARCVAVYSDLGYFGTNDGKIYQMESGGTDDGSPYACTYVGLPEHLGSPGATKTVKMARAVFLSASPFAARISASVNYSVSLPTSPSSTANYSTDVWDQGIWDVATWDGGTSFEARSRWVAIDKTGFVVSPQIQITCGVTPFPRTELIAYDLTYEMGGVLV